MRVSVACLVATMIVAPTACVVEADSSHEPCGTKPAGICTDGCGTTSQYLRQAVTVGSAVTVVGSISNRLDFGTRTRGGAFVATFDRLAP